jgi:hypothetical protein
VLRWLWRLIVSLINLFLVPEGVDVNPTLTGVAMTASAGTVGVSTGANLSGVAATASAGTVTVWNPAVALTGASATGGAGEVVGQTPAQPTATLTGAEATTGFGVMGVSIDGWDVGWERLPADVTETWTQIATPTDQWTE